MTLVRARHLRQCKSETSTPQQSRMEDALQIVLTPLGDVNRHKPPRRRRGRWGRRWNLNRRWDRFRSRSGRGRSGDGDLHRRRWHGCPDDHRDRPGRRRGCPLNRRQGSGRGGPWEREGLIRLRGIANQELVAPEARVAFPGEPLLQPHGILPGQSVRDDAGLTRLLGHAAKCAQQAFKHCDEGPVPGEGRWF